jgi:hypothetical protein
MTLCGETIVYDLHALAPDPTAIIRLLETTASERGNWMLVGCHYRRQKNARAAISVVSTMLEGQIAFFFLFL